MNNINLKCEGVTDRRVRWKRQTARKQDIFKSLVETKMELKRMKKSILFINMEEMWLQINYNIVLCLLNV